MSFCSLIKEITPENLLAVFYPNKQLYFEPFFVLGSINRKDRERARARIFHERK